MAFNGRGGAPEQPRPDWSESQYPSYYDTSSEAARLPDGSSSEPAHPGPRSRQRTRGGHWRWDSQHQDYVLERDGHILRYTEYQRGASSLETSGTTTPNIAQAGRHYPTDSSSVPADQRFISATSELSLNRQVPQSENQLEDGVASTSRPSSVTPSLTLSGPSSLVDEQTAPAPKPYETPLDDRFRVVEKPKRFFAVGRIFKTVWFEPQAQQETATQHVVDQDWASACPAFHDEKPFAKFRWFVVVRKRLHHSLCFAITTFGGRGATKASRGRAQDFVVLYPDGIEPPEPWPEEKIERDPLAVIIEEGQQYLSPAARVDCGRIYTVEDNVKVMKIGRIHPSSLADLERYYKESVE